MSKTRTAGEKTAETAEFATANGADTIKVGFEKAVKGYEAALGFSKDTAEAYAKSATIAGKGVESFGNEIYAYSKQSIEDSIAAAKAVMGAKSVHEAFEFQTDFAKTAFENYVGELSKVGELVSTTSKESFAPLQGRVQAWLDMVQTTRSA
jgi:phasin family protein